MDMARQQEAAADSFPAGNGWMANVLSSPVDGRSSTSTWTTQIAFEDYSEYEYSYRSEIQGPRDDRDLGEVLGSTMCNYSGTFSPLTNMKEIEYESYSPTSYHGMTLQTYVPVPPETWKVRERRHMPSALLPEKGEAPATMALLDEREGNEEEEEEEDEEGREGGVSTQPLGCHWRTRPAPAATPREEGGSTSAIVDLLDYMRKSGSGPRRPRQKGKWWPLPDNFGSAPCFWDLCSSSKVDKHGPRKNNEHWTPEEVKVLVDGLSELGVGKWSKLKKRWFSDSIRTAVNLKGSAPLDKEVIKKIQMLAVNNPSPK
ncbi:uncharacterized protein [Lolium perenne]|uniref:uncharacterized protein isoform X3 n=1 Tax=Lolium perenne TaxID=4522 RepID=UPI0021F54330|nr:uncharacterized protein LOC127346012 isoform X3 [Lolium perenne]